MNMDLGLDLSTGMIAGIVTVGVILVILVIWAIVRGQMRKVATGTEVLKGKIAVAQTPLDPKGMVLVEGEHWAARVNSGRVEPGEEVIVTEVNGLKLVVTKKKSERRKK